MLHTMCPVIAWGALFGEIYCVSRVPAWRACAGATASDQCTLCQPGSYQTGSGQPLLLHRALTTCSVKTDIYAALYVPCDPTLRGGWALARLCFTCRMVGVCRGYCLWRLLSLPAWVIPDWISSSVTARTLSIESARSERRASDSMPRLLALCCVQVL
jgi:hypothetical protein